MKRYNARPQIYYCECGEKLKLGQILCDSCAEELAEELSGEQQTNA